MSSKHFIDDPTHLVNTALESVQLTNPGVALDKDNKIVYRRNIVGPTQVPIVSGGGSGHEPSFAAFVGPGLLSAAVAGTIFASPSAEQVRRCILQRVDPSKGVLVIVMNYTGDILNFGMAVEKAKASGIQVEMLVVGDDAGVGRAAGGKVGRRGIVGTCLVHKIAGAMSAKGAPLKHVLDAAQLAADNVVSIGASLAHVHVPGRDKSAAEDALSSDQVEIGMGIHNEAGVHRLSAALPEMVSTMLKYMLDQDDKDRAFLKVSTSDSVAVLVNNLGGLSPLELGGITTEVVQQLNTAYDITPARLLSGTYMTSLNALGFSISILRLDNTSDGTPLIDLLDAPAEATGWTAPIASETWDRSSSYETQSGNTAESEVANSSSGLTLDIAQAKKILEGGLNEVIAAEPEVTRYDTAVGDGDCGIGLKRGAEAILSLLNDTKANDAAELVDEIVRVVETNMDGTSGALYAIYLNALATGLRSQGKDSPRAVTAQHWGRASDYALQSMSKYTPAKPGDRTLVDALAPFVSTLQQTGEVAKAAKAAEEGSAKTKGMQASLGRTVYVGDSSWQEVPDPGAYGLAKFFTGLAAAL